MTIRSTEILLWFFWSKLAGTWIMSIRLAVRYAIFMPFLWSFLAVFWISWLRQEKLAVAKMEEEERMRRGCWVKRLVIHCVNLGWERVEQNLPLSQILTSFSGTPMPSDLWTSLQFGVNQPLTPYKNWPIFQRDEVQKIGISKSGYLWAFFSTRVTDNDPSFRQEFCHVAGEIHHLAPGLFLGDGHLEFGTSRNDPQIYAVTLWLWLT